MLPQKPQVVCEELSAGEGQAVVRLRKGEAGEGECARRSKRV